LALAVAVFGGVGEGGKGNDPEGTCSSTEFELLQDRLSDDIVHWIRGADGGFIHPNVRLHKPPGGPRGIYANGTVAEGEVICTIPYELISKPSTGYQYCDTVKVLVDDIRNNRTPYGRYLASMPRNSLPARWSIPGKELLKDLIGWRLEPQEIRMEENEWIIDNFGQCVLDMDMDDELTSHVIDMVLERGDDQYMVPFYDMINHRNGEWHYNTR